LRQSFFDVTEMLSGQSNRALYIACPQRRGDRGMFVDATQRQARRLEGGHHERRTREQFAEET